MLPRVGREIHRRISAAAFALSLLGVLSVPTPALADARTETRGHFMEDGKDDE